jgi:signal transduction histidine kinase
MGTMDNKLLHTFDQLSTHLEAPERDGEGVQLLEAFIRQLVHDFRTPIGVFSLELFSVEDSLTDARSAAIGADTGKLNEAIENISDIRKNLSNAQGIAQELIDSLDARSALLASET